MLFDSEHQTIGFADHLPQVIERESIQLIQSTRIAERFPNEAKEAPDASPLAIADQKGKSSDRRFCENASDSELMMRYSVHDDGKCFEELFRRHSNLVLQVCRSILGNYSDADDAFQATFLVLVRKADRLRHVTSLSAWLYKVAFRISVKANQDRRRKSVSELQSEIAIESDQLDQISQKELMTVVFHELNQLPARYHQVLIECYLQGKSYRQTAEALDDSETAIKGLIARAKKMLRNRLIRRGVALTFAIAVLAKVKSATAAELTTGTSPAFQEVLSNAANSSSHSVSSSVQSLSQFGVPSMGSHIFLKSSIALGVVLAILLSTIGYGNSSRATAQDTDVGLTISTRALDAGSTRFFVAVPAANHRLFQESKSISGTEKKPSRIIELKHIAASRAVKVIESFFDSVDAQADIRQNVLVVTAKDETFEMVMKLVESLDVPAIEKTANTNAIQTTEEKPTTEQKKEDSRIKVFQLSNLDASLAVQIVGQFIETSRMAPNPQSNSVIMAGPANEIDEVGALLEQLDVPAKEKPTGKSDTNPTKNDIQESLEYELTELDFRRQATKLKIQALQAESQAIRRQAERSKQLVQRGLATESDYELQKPRSLNKESEALFAQADLINIEMKISTLKKKLSTKTKPKKVVEKKAAEEKTNGETPAEPISKK